MSSLVWRRDPFVDESAGYRAWRLGMWLFLLSLAMLFAASVLGLLVLRVRAGASWPADLPPLPRVLWFSTAVLLTSSATMHIALTAVRRGNRAGLIAGMIVTLSLGLVFLIAQAIGWANWLGELVDHWHVRDEHRFAMMSFFVLTGVHALHVAGGVIPMAVVTSRAIAGRYTARRWAGVHLCAMYWHFLDAVWLVLFASLLLLT